MTRSLRNLIKVACISSAAVLLGACSQMGVGAGMSTTMSSANPMSFFVTSANPGKGGDLGGLAGADAYCKKLADTAGAGAKNWRVYLSTTGAAPVNARDRIGNRPWQNAKGVVVATSVDNLHSAANNLNKTTALTEKGDVVSGRGDPVNMHDILTGSTAEGRANVAATTDTTCANWKSSGAGSAMLGHHDRSGLDESAPAKSWNASHASRGCDIPSLKATGGNGLMYCFAAN